MSKRQGKGGTHPNTLRLLTAVARSSASEYPYTLGRYDRQGDAFESAARTYWARQGVAL